VSEHGPGGEPLRVITTARDISDLQAARESQAVSDSVFRHLHEGLLITDPQHRVVDANPTFAEITGYSREELLGNVPELLNHAVANAEHRSRLAAIYMALTDEGTWQGELPHHRRNGEPCLLQLSISTVRPAAGEPVRNHVVTIVDITHTRRQLEQLQEMTWLKSASAS